MRGSRANWRPEAGPDTEKYKNEYFAAAFSDAISIYLLSLFIDVDYYDLRERDYPLLAPAADGGAVAESGGAVSGESGI